MLNFTFLILIAQAGLPTVKQEAQRAAGTDSLPAAHDAPHAPSKELAAQSMAGKAIPPAALITKHHHKRLTTLP